MVRPLFALFSTMFLSIPAIGVDLFSSTGEPIQDYRNALSEVGVGDQLSFSVTGASFQISSIRNHVDQANYSVVFGIENGEVIRLAANRHRKWIERNGRVTRSHRVQTHFEMDGFGSGFGNGFGGGTGIDSEFVDPLSGEMKQLPDEYLVAMRNFKVGWDELKNSEVSIVHVNERKSRSPYYFVVEDFNVLMLASDWAMDFQALSQQYPQAEKHWLEFVEGTWQYQVIGDFKLNQIAYDGTRWALLDFWTGNVRVPHKTIIEKTVFDSLGGLHGFPYRLQVQMKNEILKKRRLKLCESLLENSADVQP